MSRRDDVAGDQRTCVLIDLKTENFEKKRLIEEMAESSVRSGIQPRLQAGPWLEDYYKGRSTECSRQIDDILSKDTLEEMMITKEEEYTLPWDAIETRASTIIQVPFMAGYSHAVPDCIEAILSFVRHCAGFLSGTKEERHYYEVLGKHLVQLITNVLPQAISKSFESRRLSLKEEIQLYLDACRLSYFPRSKSFKREIKDKYPLIGKKYLEMDLYQDKRGWEDLNRCAWTSINRLAWSEMNWDATFLQISWVPEDNAQGAYLKPVYNYLKRLAEILRNPGLGYNLGELRNCFTSLMLDLGDCIAGIFSHDEVVNFNIRAVSAISLDLLEIQRFAHETVWLESKDDPCGLRIRSGLTNAWKWVDLLLRIEPQLYPERNSREAYYLAVMKRHHPGLDPRTVIAVCEKFVHSEGVGPGS